MSESSLAISYEAFRAIQEARADGHSLRLGGIRVRVPRGQSVTVTAPVTDVTFEFEGTDAWRESERVHWRSENRDLQGALAWARDDIARLQRRLDSSSRKREISRLQGEVAHRQSLYEGALQERDRLQARLDREDMPLGPDTTWHACGAACLSDKCQTTFRDREVTERADAEKLRKLAAQARLVLRDSGGTRKLASMVQDVLGD